MFIEHLLSDLINLSDTLLSFGTVISPLSGLGADAHGCPVRLVIGLGGGLAAPAATASPTAVWWWWEGVAWDPGLSFASTPSSRL